MIAESVECHAPAWNAPAIQDQSGKAQLRERLQATVNFPVHAIVPGKVPGNVVELRTAVNVIDERPGRIHAFWCRILRAPIFPRIRAEENAVQLRLSICGSQRDPLRNLITQFQKL